MGPTGVLSAPGGSHFGPINLAVWGIASNMHMVLLCCVLCHFCLNHVNALPISTRVASLALVQPFVTEATLAIVCKLDRWQNTTKHKAAQSEGTAGLWDVLSVRFWADWACQMLRHFIIPIHQMNAVWFSCNNSGGESNTLQLQQTQPEYLLDLASTAVPLKHRPFYPQYSQYPISGACWEACFTKSKFDPCSGLVIAMRHPQYRVILVSVIKEPTTFSYM